MKQYRGKIIAVAAVVAVLAVLFWWGGDVPGLSGRGYVPQPEETTRPVPQTEGQAEAQQPQQTPPAEQVSGEETAPETPLQQETEALPEPEMPQEEEPAEPAPQEQPQQMPEQPQEDGSFMCTLSVSCSEILNYMDWLDPSLHELVPADGIILPPTQVKVWPGESVFHVLQREMQQNRIHLEFVYTPLYDSAYIEGIANLYEFDCGEASGWVYSVNGVFYRYGSSQCILQPGDAVEWQYTCDTRRQLGSGFVEGTP